MEITTMQSREINRRKCEEYEELELGGTEYWIITRCYATIDLI